MAELGIDFKVSGQQQTQQFDTNGQEITGWNVSWEASDGNKGTVFIPDSVYHNPEAVRTEIANAVRLAAHVTKLTGSV